MQTDLSILIVASLANLIIGLFVLLKDPKNITYRLFTALTVTLIGWTTANYFSLLPTSLDNIFLAVELILVFVVLQNTFFMLFVISYKEKRLNPHTRNLVLYLLFSAITVAAGIYPGYFADYKPGPSDYSIVPVPSPAIALFMGHAIITVAIGVRHLWHGYRGGKSIIKRQYRLLLLATAALFLLTPITNFVLPNAFGISQLAPLSPVYTLIFAGIIAYAIISQKLFDIRAALARSVGYVLSLGFIGVIYGATAFIALSWLGGSRISESNEQVVYIALALVTASVYPLARSFFERITRTLFYKDTYEPQKLLDELNDTLVEKSETTAALSAVGKIIKENLKSSHSTFIVRETAYKPMRIIGDEIDLNKDEYGFLREHTIHVNQKLIIVEQLPQENNALKMFLDERNIEIAIRLVPNFDYPVEGVGYVLIGPKLNGESYSTKDFEVLDIIADELVIAIESALRFEEIENFNTTLTKEVDDATKQLKRANEKLKTLDETKDEFISMASHQLRTPLTSVKGYVSMVLEGDAGEINPTQKKLLEQSFASSQRMVYLISDLLNLSRLRTGKFVIEAKPTNLADVIESEVEQLQMGAASRSLKLSFTKPKDFPMLMIDETKIRQVIMNFSDNAIYYTPAGGKIDLKLEETAKEVRFTVNDNGIGIPKDEQHHLFGKFYRAKNAQKARPDGTGLGLFMAKKVIVAQGGAIIFKSTVGKGSIFGFSFSKEKLRLPVTETKPKG